MSSRKITVGILGCASIAERLVIPAFLIQNEQFYIKAIASRTKQKADYFSEKFGIDGLYSYEDLIKDRTIELIYMPLPTGIHEEWMMKCIEAGKHILVEKSLASNFESAKKIMDEAKKRNVFVMENFMYRYHKQHDFTFTLLNNNELGSIRLFRSSFGFPPLNKSNFRYDFSLGGGALLDAGAYTINASMWFLGEQLSVCNSIIFIDKKRNIDIYGNATLINHDGIVSQISFGFDNFYQCNYEIWGSNGFIRSEKAFTPKPHEKPVIMFSNPGNNKCFESESDNHFCNVLSEVHRCIIQDDIFSHRDTILVQAKILTEVREKAKIIYI